LVLCQTIAKVVKQAAETAGISAQLGTHAGRRTVVTTLFVDGGEALEDITCFVPHANPTSASYVKRLGRRPEAVAKRAAAVLDGQADADMTPGQSSESPGDSGTNRGSYGPGSPDKKRTMTDDKSRPARTGADGGGPSGTWGRREWDSVWVQARAARESNRGRTGWLTL
jgi:hypothetical protein